MIKFSLRCDHDHTFDSWFQDSQAYDDLANSGHIGCPQCGSVAVTKALMAPAVLTSRKRAITVKAEAAASVPAPVADQQPAVQDERALMLRAALRDMRDHLIKNSKDVGPEFAEEARRVHEGVSDHAAVHGVASREDVQSLLDDGIEVMPLPVFPDDRN